MSGIEFGLGQFGDRRLKKGEPIFMRLWWRDLARVSAGWQEPGRGRFSSRVSFATVQ